MPNVYYDSDLVDDAVRKAQHRELIGGLWDDIGRLQFEFVRSQGLEPSSRLIDVGCGCLRGGVHFVEFLERGNYYGVDINKALLDAGYDIELKNRGLQDKLPRENLVCDGEFRFSQIRERFNFALAQSLFTHLPGDLVQTCLARLAPSLEPGGLFCATFFVVPDQHPLEEAFTHPSGVKTFDQDDPYHYRISQIHELCAGLPWRVLPIGDWNHPHHQQMILFRRLFADEKPA